MNINSGVSAYDLQQSSSPHPPPSHRVSIGNGGAMKKKRLLYSNPSNEYVQHSHSQSVQQHNGHHQNYSMAGGVSNGRRNSYHSGNHLTSDGGGASSVSPNPRNSKKIKKTKKKRNRKQSTNLESISENKSKRNNEGGGITLEQ